MPGSTKHPPDLQSSRRVLAQPSTPGVAWLPRSVPAGSHLRISGAVPFSSSVPAPPQSVDTHRIEVTPHQGPHPCCNPSREYQWDFNRTYPKGVCRNPATSLGTLLKAPAYLFRQDGPALHATPLCEHTDECHMARIQECTVEGRDKEPRGGEPRWRWLYRSTHGVQPTSCCDGTGT